MQPLPLVSAVIPAYNAESVVAEAIDSVLAQSYGAIECIVVNDGSSDATAEVVRSYGSNVTLLDGPNQGVAAARNRGAAASSGKYIGFLDADDLWLPDKVERLLTAFEAPRVGLAYCIVQLVDRDLRSISELQVHPEELIRNILFSEGPVVTAIFGLLTSRAFEAVGGFDVRLSTGADADLTCRIAQLYETVCIAEPLTLWRQHGDQMHRNPDLLRNDSLIILNRFLGEARSAYFPFRSRAYANLYLMLSIAYLHERRWRDSGRNLGLALRQNPRRTIERLGELVRTRLTAGRPS